MCASFKQQRFNIFDSHENQSFESQQDLSSKTSTCSAAGGDAKSPAAWVKISGFGLDFVTSQRKFKVANDKPDYMEELSQKLGIDMGRLISKNVRHVLSENLWNQA